MTRCLPLLLLSLLASASNAAAQSTECRPDDAGVRAIRSVATGIVSADNKRDIKRVLDYYAPDAILMPPGDTSVVGRDKIRPRYEELFASFTPEIEIQIEEACVAAGLGFVRGRNTGHLVPRASGEGVDLDDAFLMLLRLEPDHVWRISHLIWHRQSKRQNRTE